MAKELLGTFIFRVLNQPGTIAPVCHDQRIRELDPGQLLLQRLGEGLSQSVSFMAECMQTSSLCPPQLCSFGLEHQSTVHVCRRLGRRLGCPFDDRSEFVHRPLCFQNGQVDI